MINAEKLLTRNYLFMRTGESEVIDKPFIGPTEVLTDKGEEQVHIGMALFDVIEGFSEKQIIYAAPYPNLTPGTVKAAQEFLSRGTASSTPQIYEAEALKDSSSEESPEEAFNRMALLLMDIESNTDEYHRRAETVLFVAEGKSLETLESLNKSFAWPDSSTNRNLAPLNPGEIRELYRPQNK